MLGTSTEFRRVVWSSPSGKTCVDTSAAVFTYEIPPAISNNTISHESGEVCAGSLLTINGETPGNGYSGNFTFRWLSGPAAGNYTDSIDGAGLVDLEDQMITDDKYFVRKVFDEYCTSETAPLMIHRRSLPVAVLTLADETDTVICEGRTYLKVDITNIESHVYHDVDIAFSSTFASGTVDTIHRSKDLFNTPVEPHTDDSTTYTYNISMVKDDFGCEAVSMTGSPTIKVFQMPEPAILTETVEVCGESLSVQGSARNGATGAEWVQLDPVNGTVSFDAPTSETATMTLDNTDGYDVSVIQLGWKLSTPKCDSTAVKTITFYEQPEVYELLKDSFEFYVDDTISLKQFIQTPDAGTGNWSVDNSGPALLGADSATNFAYETESIFTWTVTNGVCQPVSDEIIIIQHDLRKYEGFSPNNDQMNDVYVIAGLKYCDDFTFTLYNGWGTKLYTIDADQARLDWVEIDGVEVTDYILWDGTFGNGETAAAGTYYFSLDYSIGGKEYEPQTGYIILRR